MQIEELRELDRDEIRHRYKVYLKKQNKSASTIETSVSDALYLLRHNSDVAFWGLLASDHFEENAKAVLEETLAKHSKGNVSANIGGYLSHLKMFRHFVFSLGSETFDEVSNEMQTSGHTTNFRPIR